MDKTLDDNIEYDIPTTGLVKLMVYLFRCPVDDQFFITALGSVPLKDVNGSTVLASDGGPMFEEVTCPLDGTKIPGEQSVASQPIKFENV